MTKIFSARIAIGEAREEDREPSMDNQYLTLYWREGPGWQGKWCLESNAGVCASSSRDYVENVAEAVAGFEEEDEEIEKAKEIQAEIDSIIEGDGIEANPCRMGYEAMDYAIDCGWFSDDWFDENC